MEEEKKSKRRFGEAAQAKASSSLSVSADLVCLLKGKMPGKVYRMDERAATETKGGCDALAGIAGDGGRMPPQQTRAGVPENSISDSLAAREEEEDQVVSAAAAAAGERPTTPEQTDVRESGSDEAEHERTEAESPWLRADTCTYSPSRTMQVETMELSASQPDDDTAVSVTTDATTDNNSTLSQSSDIEELQASGGQNDGVINTVTESCGEQAGLGEMDGQDLKHTAEATTPPNDDDMGGENNNKEKKTKDHGSKKEKDNCDGDVKLYVECGVNKGVLYLNRLCSGSKGACILHDCAWLTPNEFQYVSGRETAKDWKRSIKHHGKSLKLLMAKGILLSPVQQQQVLSPGSEESDGGTGSRVPARPVCMCDECAPAEVGGIN